MFSSSFPAELSQQFQFGAIITSVLARLQDVADGSVSGVSEAVSKVGGDTVHVVTVCVSPLSFLIRPLYVPLLITASSFPDSHAGSLGQLARAALAGCEVRTVCKEL